MFRSHIGVFLGVSSLCKQADDKVTVLHLSVVIIAVIVIVVLVVCCVVVFVVFSSSCGKMLHNNIKAFLTLWFCIFML